MTANVGDWIIRGVKGEFYPCKPDIFAATYEPVCQMERIIEGKAEEIRNAFGQKSDALAQAFISETGLKPSECELVQQNSTDKIVFYYRKREGL